MEMRGNVKSHSRTSLVHTGRRAPALFPISTSFPRHGRRLLRRTCVVRPIRMRRAVLATDFGVAGLRVSNRLYYHIDITRTQNVSDYMLVVALCL